MSFHSQRGETGYLWKEFNPKNRRPSAVRPSFTYGFIIRRYQDLKSAGFGLYMTKAEQSLNMSSVVNLTIARQI